MKYTNFKKNPLVDFKLGIETYYVCPNINKVCLNISKVNHTCLIVSRREG